MKACLKHIYLLLLVTPLLACNFSELNTAPSTPLVIDLAAVARALGREEEIVQKLEQAQQSLNAQLAQLGKDLQQQLQIEKEKRGDKPDEAEQKELETLTLQANLKLRQTRQLAQQKAELYRVQLLKAFRDEALTAAQQVAQERHATAVVAANSDLLWHAQNIDITDEVIGVLRAKQLGPRKERPTTSQANPELERLDRIVDSIEAEQATNAANAER